MKQVDVFFNEKKVGYIAPGSHGKSALYINGCVFETEGVFNTPIAPVIEPSYNGVIEMARVANVLVRNTSNRWSEMVAMHLVYPHEGGVLKRIDLPPATYQALSKGAQETYSMQFPAPVLMPSFSGFARAPSFSGFARESFNPDRARCISYDTDGTTSSRSFKRLRSPSQGLGVELIHIEGLEGVFGLLTVDQGRGMLITMDQELLTPVAAGHIESGILRVDAWYCEPFPVVYSPRVMTLKSTFDECEYAVVLTEDQPTGGNVRYAGAGRVLRIDRPVTGKGVYKALVGLAEVPSTPGIPAVLEVSVDGDEIVATIVA